MRHGREQRTTGSAPNRSGVERAADRHVYASGCTVLCMRITLNLDDQLLTEAKRHAAKTRRTLTSVVEDGLRLALRHPKPSADGTREIRLPTSGRGGLFPSVDLDDSGGLLDHMEGKRPHR